MKDFAEVSAEQVRITARGPVRDAGERMVGKLWIDQIPVRFASEDPALWRSRPHGSESAVCWPARLGPARAMLGEIDELVERTRAAGLTEVVLLGSGPTARAAHLLTQAGSMVGIPPEMRSYRRPLSVLDGSDPGPLLRIGADDERLFHALVVITAEGPGPDALRRVFEHMLRERGLPPDEIAQRFIVVAEPDGPLAMLGREAGHTVIAGTTGPVFGALSPAALVPAALAGVDVAELLDQADVALPSLVRPEHNPGLVLGAILGGCARVGRDKVIIGDFAAQATGIGDWIAPLLIRATGGELCTVVQNGGLPLRTADDLFHVAIDGRPLQDDATVSGPLGAQIVVWEYAAAVAAYLLKADPFAATHAMPAITMPTSTASSGTGGEAEEPPSADAGRPAFTVGPAGEGIEVYADDGLLPDTGDLANVLDMLLKAIPADGHLSILAYLDPDRAQGQGNGVRRLAALLAARCGRPVRVDWHPFSPVLANDLMAKGVYLILTGNVMHDIAVPERRYRLSGLQLTEALGIVRVLGERGRSMVRLHLQSRDAGIAQLLKVARGGG